MANHSSGDGVLSDVVREDIEIECGQDDSIIREDDITTIFQDRRVVIVLRDNSTH
jgi:hypothetical protein